MLYYKSSFRSWSETTIGVLKRRPKQRQIDAWLLFVHTIEPITTSSLLTSGHVNLAMELISDQFHLIGGLYCTTIGAKLEYPAPQEEKWLKIVHNPNAKLWVVVTKGLYRSELSVYDSLQFNTDSRQHTVSCIHKLSPSRKSVVVKLCQRQDNYNCSVFSIPFSIAYCQFRLLVVEFCPEIFFLSRKICHLPFCLFVSPSSGCSFG